MSRIKTLKEQFPHLDISLLDILSELDGTQSHKYLQLLCKVLSNSHSFEIKNNSSLDRISYVNEINEKLSSYQLDTGEPLNPKYIKFRLIENFYNPSDINTFLQFRELNERGLIQNSDLTKYSSIDEIMSAVSLCEIQLLEKELENEVIKEFEDEKWLLVRPLSFQSSLRYGSSTKWCTTFKREKDYFFKYFYRGTLVYFINKETGYKVAFYGECSHKLVDISFWNQQDNRCDFFEVDIDEYLLPEIRRIVTTNRTNASYLSQEKLFKVAEECNSLYRIMEDVKETEEPRNLHVIVENPRYIEPYANISQESQEMAEYHARSLTEINPVPPPPTMRA
jgi:hypothetical protein